MPIIYTQNGIQAQWMSILASLSISLYMHMLNALCLYVFLGCIQQKISESSYSLLCFPCSHYCLCTSSPVENISCRSSSLVCLTYRIILMTTIRTLLFLASMFTFFT